MAVVDSVAESVLVVVPIEVAVAAAAGYYCVAGDLEQVAC